MNKINLQPGGQRIYKPSITAVLAVSLTIMLLFSAFSSIKVFASDCSDIRRDVLRLHILANSDSERDQQLKLAVRDCILKLDSKLFSEAKTKEEATKAANAALLNIKKQAELELRKHGCNDMVNVELTNMYFTTREYESFVLPAGKYDALRVTIGKAEGKNWWCVLYPPLCLPAATAESEPLESLEPLTERERELISGKEKYQFKFAFVELIESIKQSFEKK